MGPLWTKLTEAIRKALRESPKRGQFRTGSLAQQLREIADRSGRLPVSDTRGADEIVGYDERGLPR